MFQTIQPLPLRRRMLGFATSTGVLVFVACMLIALPLIFFDKLPESVKKQIEMIAYAAPPPPLPPPPPWMPETKMEPPRGDDYRVRFYDLIPDEIPREIPPPDNEPPLTFGDSKQFPGNPPPGIGNIPGPAGDFKGFGPPAATPMPPPPPPPPKKTTALRIGGSVLEAKLIHRVDPVYPELAKRARVEGTIVLEVLVDETGHVTSVRVAKGNPLLDAAAVTAVEQWLYSPTILNNEPVAVSATVTVIFRLR